MNQLVHGTLEAENQPQWSLNKTGAQKEMASYELRAQAAGDAQAPEIMMQVISGLLKGMHVGVTAACGEHGLSALNRLTSVWHDGRVLKRGQGGMFVALDHGFGGLESDGLAPCVGTGTAFRFLGFDGHVIEDTMFRGMMGGDSAAAIEVSCRDFADGVLSIRFDADKIDEAALRSGISAQVKSSGRLLRVGM